MRQLIEMIFEGVVFVAAMATFYLLIYGIGGAIVS
jgi:hypothetical protein